MSLAEFSNTGSGLLPKILPGHDISIQEMYNISTRNNTVWGIEGYTVPRHYQDPKKTGDKRPAPRELKKLDYLHGTLKASNGVPAPNKYDIVKPWVDEKNGRKSPKHVTKRNTYIDNILNESKKRPTPGPGAHNIIETEEQIKKKQEGHKEVKGSERTNFLCEVEFISNSIPGPGNYNPREIQPKIKETKMKPEDWKKKHTEERKRNTKSARPDVGTYNPFPADFKTFGKDLELSKEKKIRDTKAWGTATRFAPKKDPKKDPNAFPGPGTYAMLATWNGKLPNGKQEKGEKNWMNKITKGVEKSIYY